MTHLTYEDRLTIQRCLKEGMSFTAIAERIGKSRSTVSREVTAHRKMGSRRKVNACVNRFRCNIKTKCAPTAMCPPRTSCWNCRICNERCGDFELDHCAKLLNPPYVCNGCTELCGLERWVYDAQYAQKEYELIRRESREGISISEKDLKFLEEKVVPLIMSGCSVPVACNAVKDEMPICEKTMYSYINRGMFNNLGNMDLRLKCRRPLRKKSGPVLRVDKACHIGRSYSEYREYICRNPDFKTVQMDTVIGRKGGKVVLSLFFTSCDVQLFFLRERNTAASVTQVFSELKNKLGDDFTKVFPVLLTDRGSEFTDPAAIECCEETGEILCRVFYCEPLNSNQKSNCERNHELFRYVSPRGKSFDACSQKDIARAANHINSYPR